MEYLQGLLSDEQMSDARNRAIFQGLGALGAQLSKAGAPSLMPQGSGLAEGLAGFNQAYQGSFDTTLQNIARNMQLRQAVEKQQKEKQFNERIAQAISMRPSGTGLTSTSKGSQAEMLSRPEFGGDFLQETVGALQSNPNLPQQRVIDQSQYLAALAEFRPEEYAKMLMTGEKKPDAIKTFEAFASMNPQQQQEFLKFRASAQPQTNISLGDKGADKIQSKAVEGYMDRAGSARQMAIASNVVADLLEKQGGGKVVQLGTDLARTLGLGDKESIAAADAAAALVTQTAVKVRPEGSGSTSNIEFDAYRQSVPSLANSAQGRRLMAQINEAFANRNELLADYAMQLYRDGRYSLKAMRDFDKSLGSILPKDFDAQVKAIKSSGGSTTSTQRRDFRE